MIHKMISVPKNGTNEIKDHQREIPTRPKIRHEGISVATDSAVDDATIRSLLWTTPPPAFCQLFEMLYVEAIACALPSSAASNIPTIHDYPVSLIDP
jgi:hypothetical protein